MNANASEVIADAVRRALEDLDTFPVEAHLRAAVVILDVMVPDPAYPNDPGEAFTHTVWRTAPNTIGTTHAFGIVSVAAQAMLSGESE